MGQTGHLEPSLHEPLDGFTVLIRARDAWSKYVTPSIKLGIPTRHPNSLL